MLGLAITFSIFILSSFLLISILISLLRTGVPTIASAAAAQKQIAEYINKGNPDLVYELGSGKGDFVFKLANYIPNAKIVGIELSPAPYLVAKLRRLFSKNKTRISFVLANFHNVDLSKVDAVAFYLMPKPNLKLRPKLEKELKKGAVVGTVSFRMPNWKADQTLIAPNFSKTHCYIYEMPAKKLNSEQNDNRK